MKKSVAKRIRVTKTGKLLRRKMAQDHFRAKKSGAQIRHKRVWRSFAPGDARKILQYLSAVNI